MKMVSGRESVPDGHPVITAMNVPEDLNGPFALCFVLLIQFSQKESDLGHSENQSSWPWGNLERKQKSEV